MRPGRPGIIVEAQREELWRRYKAGETILGIVRALGQRSTTIDRCFKVRWKFRNSANKLLEDTHDERLDGSGRWVERCEDVSEILSVELWGAGVRAI
jgi:hypothetical protein